MLKLNYHRNVILYFVWDESVSVSRCTTVEVAGSVGRGRPKKTWEEVMKMDLRERRVGKDRARDRLAWK